MLRKYKDRLQRALILAIVVVIVTIVAVLYLQHQSKQDVYVVKSPRNAEDAKQEATQFCSKVGWKWSQGEQASIEPPADHIIAGKPANRWRLHSHDYDVDLDKNTGEIRCALYLNALSNRTFNVVKITQSEAITFSEKYIKAAGISLSDYRLLYQGLSSNCSAPGHQYWAICFNKMYKGYLYDYPEQITVWLDPIDGSLISLSNPGSTPIPASVDIKLSKEDAVKAATVFFAAKGYKLQSVKKAELKIVLPNNLWDTFFSKSTIYKQASASRLAWVISFFDSGPRSIQQVKVDAETGEVVG